VIWLSGDWWFNQEHGRYAGLTVSRDGGQTWEDLRVPMPESAPAHGIPETVSSPAFWNADRGYFTASYTLRDPDGSSPRINTAFFSSKDGGRSWTPRSNVLTGFYAYGKVDVVSPDDLFVACDGKLCASHNGAQTWQMVPLELGFPQEESQGLLDFDFIDPLNGWVLAALPDGQTGLFRTVDRGQSWENLSPILK
jgi:photosystem II stability/assembly factor-like uncharacterized protein